jgi:hypothetical protein
MLAAHREQGSTAGRGRCRLTPRSEVLVSIRSLPLWCLRFLDVQLARRATIEPFRLRGGGCELVTDEQRPMGLFEPASLRRDEDRKPRVHVHDPHRQICPSCRERARVPSVLRPRVLNPPFGRANEQLSSTGARPAGKASPSSGVDDIS